MRRRVGESSAVDLAEDSRVSRARNGRRYVSTTSEDRGGAYYRGCAIRGQRIAGDGSASGRTNGRPNGFSR